MWYNWRMNRLRGNIFGFLRQLRALVRLSFVELWRRNDIFAMFVLACALIVPLSMSEPFGAHGASRYLDEVALLLVWAYSLFVSLGTGARLFPPEFESRTILTLLAKPVSRRSLLVGKYAGAVAASWSALAFFYALFVLAALLRGGGLQVAALAQAFVLHLAFCALAVALSLFGSLLLTQSANLTLSAAALCTMFFFGRRLPSYADAAPPALSWLVKAAYALGPHAEFFDMRQRVVHGWGAVEWPVLLAVLGYAFFYIAALLALSSVALRRRRF